ncbi:Short-chain dehydrogenase/reductase SDR [Trinorchestia longiramus]|nr:Short-chain dehydrogenase/reductase SDR [Trinorchestia longiramus]
MEDNHTEDLDTADPCQEDAVSKEGSLKQPLLTLDRLLTVVSLGLLSLGVRCVLGAVCVSCPSLLALLLWLGAAAAFLTMSSRQLPVQGKSVLITGCDTGIGNQLALFLHTGGLRVFALCLEDGEGAQQLRGLRSPRLHVLLADVTKPEQLQRARQQLQQLLPEGECLWGVINNAGIAAFGDVEWLPLHTYRNIYEVNVVGTLATIQTFLPLVRRARGRIVNVASMLGRMGVPMRSPYVASKFAVEGLSDCLRHEMRSWGVSVVVIEPGNFVAGTNIFTEESVEKSAQEMWNNMSEEVKQDYGEDVFQERVTLMKSYITGGATDLTPVLQSFSAALLDATPQARYQPMDLYYKTRVFIASHCPEWVYDNIYVGCLNK